MAAGIRRAQLEATYRELDQYKAQLWGFAAEVVESCTAVVSEHMEARPVPFWLTEKAEIYLGNA